MTALESFNALDNREVSRKEVEQVLAQAKAENNTAIIYRLSRVLNDSPEATHFEITITHYDSSVGLSGVQHTGDYREALDDCGRLRKGWKFVKGNVVKVEEKPKKEAKPKKEKAPQKEKITKEVSGPKVKDFEAFDDLQAQLLAKNADIPESEVLDFLYNFTDAFEEGKTVFRFWNTPGKKPTEAVLQYKKHPLLTRLQNPSAKMRAYELTPRGYELLEKFHKGVERIKKTYDLGYIAGIHKLYNFLRDRKAYTKKENVEDSSKKKLEKAPAKATKSLKSRKEKGENVANFTLLQEPTKVFLEFEDEKNQAYYKKSANKQGKDRKLKLKSYDVGKKKSRDPQGGLPSAEGSQLFKAVQSTQEPVATLQDEGIEPLSEGKGTKKSLSRKKKDENFGLNASEAPVTSLPAPRQTLAQQLATRPEVRESFLVADEQMSLFLGALEKKTKDSLVITLTGKQGSGKTRFAFQFMNALAQRYRVGHASIEEHPESVLYEEKAYQYLNDTALEHITAQDVRSLAELDTMIRTNEVIVIDSFQKMRELAPHFEIDKDLRKKYDGKLFLVIFQQTADGKMRGGSKSQFDGDIILFTETFPDYRENYVYPDKNRYNKRPATELQYSIYEQRMLATAPEVPALPAHYEPTESEELNFEVL